MTRARIMRVALLTLAACGSCSSSKARVPEATLAHSLVADAELRPILNAWSHGTKADRIAMEPAIAAFGARRGTDQTARVADVLLAWIALERGELDEAARNATRAHAEAAPGTVSDLAITVEGAALRRQGKPAEAFVLLSPLVSKLIDPWARALFNEEIVRSAVDAGKTREALALMRVWLREATPEDKDTARAVIAKGLERASRDALLEVIERPPTDADEDVELRKLVATRLAEIADKANDAALAQRLLQRAPALLGKDSERVAQLATGVSRARVEARTVGLLLDLGDEAARRHGAEIVQGVAFGLGLPGSAARLVSRDAHSRAGADAKKRLEDALAALSADGASVIIAGGDELESDVAADFAESKHVPVILLEPPARERPGGASFVVGTSRAAIETALVSGLVAKGASPIALVQDEGRPPEARRPEVTWIRGCHDAPGAWRTSGVLGVVITASVDCARDALMALPPQIRVAVGFNADELKLPTGSLTIQAGLYPFDGTTTGEWLRDHPTPPSFRAALARDAAVLAWGAVQGLPAEGTEDPNEVVARRARVRATLAMTTAQLWTTDASGFGGARALPRTISVREAPRRQAGVDAR